MNKSNTLFVFTSLLFTLLSHTVSSRPAAPAVPIRSDVVAEFEVSQSLSLIGKLQSKQFVNIAPEVVAKVTKIAVKPNQTVKKGQLLIELNDGKAKALLAEANAYLHDEERKLKDYQRLIKKQAVTQTEYDGQVAIVEIAKARLLAGQIFIDNHRIVAPFAGTIGLIDFSEGKMASIGETLLTLDNLSEMTLDLAIPERYLSMLKLGMEVTGTSRAWPGHIFSGKIIAVDSRVNPDTLNLRVRLLFDNKDHKLKPGMLLSTQLVFDPIHEPIIAVQALEYSGTKRYVYVITEENKVERREVTLGARIKDQAVIESGLMIGERIVVQGLVNMRDGITVKDLDSAASDSENKLEGKKKKNKKESNKNKKDNN